MKPIINHFQRFFSILYYKRKKDKFLSNTSIKELNDLSEYSFLNNFGKIHYFEKDKLWLVTGYDEIKYILKNEHVFTTSELYKNIDHLEILMGELNDRSRMVRKMIKEIISEKLFAQLEIFLNLESENLINILLQKNEINFQKEFSEKITLKVMCFFFGFKDDLTTDLLKKYEPEMQDFEKIMQFFDFIYNNNAVFEENRLADQLKKLIDEKTISVEEAGLISRIVWFAGIDTTSLLISNLLISIIKDKSIVVKLKQNPK
jgi:cytochrome P450